MSAKLVIGCGYLGKRVAARWKRDGHVVYATTRSNERAKEFRELGWEPVVCDVTEPSVAPLPAVDTVVYCVGMDRSSGKSMREVYVDGLRNVLDTLFQCHRFIYVSSTGAYGDANGDEVTETSTIEPDSESGRVVRDAEKALREKLPEAIILRFAGIYGPERSLRADAIRRGEPISGDSGQWLNLIHVDDGAAAVSAAEERGLAGETYNVSDGTPVRREDYLNYLADLLSAPPVTFDGRESRRSANRRISNRRLREELMFDPSYPTYREGLQHALAGSTSK